MADTKYVVSNVLCYIANRYGKSDNKSLRDIVSDFYDSEELGRAVSAVCGYSECYSVFGIHAAYTIAA